VGAGDLVATMVAGARFGTVLLWAALLGTVLKLALAEGVGRWHLASGTTLLDGSRSLGYWATGFFGFYIVIWGFMYGATAVLGDDRRPGRAGAGLGPALRGVREVHDRAGHDQVPVGRSRSPCWCLPTSATWPTA